MDQSAGGDVPRSLFGAAMGDTDSLEKEKGDRSKICLSKSDHLPSTVLHLAALTSQQHKDSREAKFLIPVDFKAFSVKLQGL